MNNNPLYKAYNILTKPIGPICNLDCEYCFYLEKEKLYHKPENYRMPDDVLESFIRQYIESQNIPEIIFGWQGGEPTLLGVAFFRKVVELQKKYAGGKKISNSFQTNGVLLNDEWGEFLAEHSFLIGLSVDGPRELHDRYRIDKQKKPTFDLVMHGLEILRKHHVEFNTLTCIHKNNVDYPIEIYRFLKNAGSQYMQFIPIVERKPDTKAKELGLELATPPNPSESQRDSPVTPWTVSAKKYGEFLIALFNEWVENDVGHIFVQHFDVALANWMGLESPLCIFAKKCGRALALEHDGRVYSCDHYVYPDYELGNLMDNTLESMVFSPQQVKFGNDKEDTLPKYCRECDVRFACHGECPKHRFIKTPDGEPGLNYLCPAYKLFFHHIDPYMKVMAKLVGSLQPASLIMDLIKESKRNDKPVKIGPNDPCPCRSGKKFKKCCGIRS
jgi:uncharacterized protein